MNSVTAILAWLWANRLTVAGYALGAFAAVNTVIPMVDPSVMVAIIGVATALGVHVAGSASTSARTAHASAAAAHARLDLVDDR